MNCFRMPLSVSVFTFILSETYTSAMKSLPLIAILLFSVVTPRSYNFSFSLCMTSPEPLAGPPDIVLDYSWIDWVIVSALSIESFLNLSFSLRWTTICCPYSIDKSDRMTSSSSTSLIIDYKLKAFWNEVLSSLISASFNCKG